MEGHDLLWQVSGLKKLTRGELLSVDIAASAEDILRATSNTSLRRDGFLIYGLSNVLNRKAQLLLQDSFETDRNLNTAFTNSPYSSQRSGRRRVQVLSQPTVIAEADLDIATILDRASESIFRGDQGETPDSSPVASPFAEDSALYDRSIDAVARSGGVALSDNLSDQLNEADQQTLNNVLSGLVEQDEVNSPEPELAMDSGDLSMNIDSSSPPPEVSTPPDDDFESVTIAADTIDNYDATELPMSDEDDQALRPVKRRKQRKRTALFDTVTTNTPSNTPSAKIVRPSRQITEDTQLGVLDPLDSQTLRLLDASYITSELKRRRILGDDETNEEDSVVMDTPLSPEVDYDLDQAVDLSDGAADLGDANDGDAGPNFVFPELSNESPMEAYAAAARETIEAALSTSGRGSLKNVSEGGNLAAIFSELLSMSTKGALICEQKRPFEDVVFRSVATQ